MSPAASTGSIDKMQQFRLDITTRGTGIFIQSPHPVPCQRADLAFPYQAAPARVGIMRSRLLLSQRPSNISSSRVM